MKYLKESSELYFESVINESIVYFSPNLRMKLRYALDSSPIARDLLDIEGEDITSDITFIDVGDDGYWTFRQMKQAMSMIRSVYPGASDADLDVNFLPGSSDILYNNDMNNSNKSTGVFKSNRNQIKIGKAINKLLNGRYTNEYIEKFVNIFKSLQMPNPEISIVEGDDIAKCYDTKNYLYNDGSIGNSCMNNNPDYLKIYTRNPDSCRMVILTEKGKLTARALLWKLDKSDIPGSPTYFMDRVYSVLDRDVYILKDYAEKEGWAYRAYNSYGQINSVVYKNKNHYPVKMEVKLKRGIYSKYPYLDTFKRYDPHTGTLYNDTLSLGGIFLDTTSGNYSDASKSTTRFGRFMNRIVRRGALPLIESNN